MIAITEMIKPLGCFALDDAQFLDPARVGLKAYRLSILAHHGFPVPPGAVVPAEVTASFWRNGKFYLTRAFSEALWARCIPHLGDRLIVRSSGQEDGETLSFAGQFESVVDVNSPEKFHEALETCIRSSRAIRVSAYAAAAGNHDGASAPFAVLVMPQREFAVSGILFSKTKLGNRPEDYIAIQVSQGNNFELTSGSATGDILYLDRQTGTVKWALDRTVTECSLQMLSTLHHLAMRLEQFCGFPVDLEWGCTNSGVIEILQVRPITSSSGSCGSADLRLQVISETTEMMRHSVRDLHSRGVNVPDSFWSDENIAEQLTDHPSRMAFGLFTYIFADGYGAIRHGRNLMGYEIGPEIEQGFFELIGGQPRCSIVHYLLCFRIKGISLVDYVEGVVQRYLLLIQQDIRLANYSEVVLYEQNPALEELVALFGQEKGQQYYRCHQEFFANIRTLEKTVAKEFQDQFVPAFTSHIREARKRMNTLSVRSTEALVGEAHVILESLRTWSCVMFVRVARLGFFAYARLRKLLEELFPAQGRQILEEVTAGLADDASLLFNVRLAEYRDSIISLDDLIEEYGHLGPNELEIANPRYRNQPRLLEKLAGSLQGNPAVELRNRAQAAAEAALQVCTKLPSSLVPVFQEDLQVARQYLAMREQAKFFYLMEYDLLRQVLIALSRKLEIEESLIFELDPRELPLLITKPEETIDLMTAREQERAIIKHLPVPQVLFLGNVKEIGREAFDPNARVLIGIGVTPITTTGKAVVILNPHDTEAIGRLEPGCVLVTTTTDPTWAPIIAAVGGNGALVTETGGPLSHGAIVARDLGIACVQNVPGATKRFKTGDTICVDGKHGTVSLVEPETKA